MHDIGLGSISEPNFLGTPRREKNKLSFEDDPEILNGESFFIDLKTPNYDTSVCHDLARLAISHINKTDKYYRSDHVLVKLYNAEAWKDVGDRILFFLNYSTRKIGDGKKKLLQFDTYVLYDSRVEERAEVAAYYDHTRAMTPEESDNYSYHLKRSGGFDIPHTPCIKWRGEIVPIHQHLFRNLNEVCVELAKLAVATFNKDKPKGSEGELEFVELVKAMWKQDFQCVYYLTFEAEYKHVGKVPKIYEAIVHTRWNNKHEVSFFRLKDSNSWFWNHGGFDPDCYSEPDESTDDEPWEL